MTSPSGTEPVVAIVGRPNVGKSTLVNRIVGRRSAIVEEKPGVTRDRKQLDASWNGRRFLVLDTGGWLPSSAVSDDPVALTRQVSAQAERAIAEAALIILVVDVTVGIVDEDHAVARLLQSTDTPVLVAVNKVDDTGREADTWGFARLGLGDPFPISATHGRGTADLLDAVVAGLGPEPDIRPEPEAHIFSVAIVGRPNVGKSTIFNRLVDDERSIVHDHPGTTRDAIDTVIDTEDGPLRFIDTAGMRRRSRIDEATEYYGLLRALDAVDRADAALLMIDASQGVTHQDQRLAERIDAAGTAIVVVLNKWDLVTDADERKQVLEDVHDRLSFLGYAPVLKVSASTGRSTQKLLPALREAEAAYHRRIPTAALNRLIQDAQTAHPAPPVRKSRPRVLYATQGAVDPPTFTLFVSHELPATYLRYLERRIREAFELGPTPIKVRVRKRS
ncbi:MAG TPA: ribosome biogenesis GTPase Der [Acidimicrobiia bacterium]|nr:ribosome biogenesis GTPase Der [Acidimicrobiia bacterium]